MAAGFFISLAAGTIFNMLATSKQGEAQAQQAERNADLKRTQAQEVLDRADINIKALMRDVSILQAKQVAAGAKQGGGRANLVLLESTAVAGFRAAQNIRREAAFRAQMLEVGADIEIADANDQRKAAMLNVFGQTLSGLGAGASGMSKLPQTTGMQDVTPKTIDTRSNTFNSQRAGGPNQFITSGGF